MINKELFLDLVQNHHHRGDYTDGKGNFCLLGSIAKATDSWESLETDDSTDFKKLKAAVINQIDTTKHIFIHHFNDDTRVSHEDIMLVAKKAVEEL